MKSNKDKFVFFWGGTFSQWATSKFVIDGVKYNTCEQYMMAKKALMFNDTIRYELIMVETNPAEQKALGKLVLGFDKEWWETYCRKIVYDANYAKFTQNPKMLEELMSTEGREIVEASPTDTIWGIGMGANHPDVADKTKWKGTNWLGEAIMKVRETLQIELSQFDYK